MRKFNPDYHGNIVRNWKDTFKNQWREELTLSDERIFQETDEMGRGGLDQEDILIFLKQLQDGDT
ncbi:MAG: hypothetical protein QQN63_06215 [Nitrosopumilus sp.]